MPVLAIAFDRGTLVLVAAVLIWPVGAGIVAAVRGTARERWWRPFAWAAVVATGLALALLAFGAFLFQLGGTTRAMASLGYQIAAGVTLLGAATSGLVAVVLRLTARER